MKRDGARVIAATLAATIITISTSSLANAAPPNKLGVRPAWGACGLSSSPTKLVYDFGSMDLHCGDSAYGYNHIKARHKPQFALLAGALGRSWEDLVYFSIAWAENDPEASRSNPSNGKRCRSRGLWLANDNGLVLSRKIYKVIYLDTGRILTAFPGSTQCRNQDVGLGGADPVSIPITSAHD